MAKILYAPGIEVVSGALSKINTKSNHAEDQNMFLATHRTAHTMSKTCSRAYMRKINSLPWQGGNTVSSETLVIREHFTVKQRAVIARGKALATISADQAAFKALNDQLKSKTGLTATWKLFLWAGAEKYLSGNSVVWPEGAINLTYEEFYEAVRVNRARQGQI